MGDRFKVRILAADWGKEIGVDPMTLARALMKAALAGEFEGLLPANRVTVFDEERLIHSPVIAQTFRHIDTYVDMAIRTGTAWIHKDAVVAFASADGRGYLLPQGWSAGGVAEYSKVADLISARPSFTKEAARALVKEAVGAGYSKEIFEQAWRARAGKTSGGRPPRKNPSQNLS